MQANRLRGRLTRVVVPVIITLVTIAVFGAAVHTSLQASSFLHSTQEVSGWTGANDQLQCLRTEFRRDVPRGSQVWVGHTADNADAQMLAEVAALWAVPTADLKAAQWSVVVEKGTTCVGLTLQVVPLR